MKHKHALVPRRFFGRHGLLRRSLQANDPGYDEARKVHNGLVDKRPRVIARCRDTSDIVGALNLARKQDLEAAVRGGGHNVAGRAVVDDGLMIDVSTMKAVEVDPERRTARRGWRDVGGVQRSHAGI